MKRLAHLCLPACGIAFGLSGLAFAQSETLVYVPDNNSNSVRKYVAQTGEYKGLIGAGFVQNVRGVEQSPFDGYLYVTSRFVTGTASTGSVVRLDPYTGAYAGLVGSGFLENPDDITFGPNGIMYVTDIRAGGNAILRFDPVDGSYEGLLGLGFLGTATTSGSSIVADSSNNLYVIGASGTAIQKFNGATGAYGGMIGTGFFDQGRGLELAMVDGFETLLNGSSASTGSVFRFRTTDSSFRGLIATGGFAPLVRGTAMMPNGWILVRAFSTGTEYIARFVPGTGEYKGLLAANWNLSGAGLATEQTIPITGSLIFGDYIGSGVARPVVFELLDASNNVIETQTINVTPNGTSPVSFSFPVYTRGTGLKVRANGTRWLREQSGTITVARNGATGITLSMANGDVDQSGEVDAADIDLVIANFGNVFPGPGLEDADVDGSTEVDAADIDIVIANFGSFDD